jgi:hypothetical protein
VAAWAIDLGRRDDGRSGASWERKGTGLCAKGIFSSEDPFRVFEYSRLASFMHEHSRELRKTMIAEGDD